MLMVLMVPQFLIFQLPQLPPSWCFVSIQAGTCPDYRQHASLHHCVALALLSRLLPGSEHLAYQVLLDLAFNPEFLP